MIALKFCLHFKGITDGPRRTLFIPTSLHITQSLALEYYRDGRRASKRKRKLVSWTKTKLQSPHFIRQRRRTCTLKSPQQQSERFVYYGPALRPFTVAVALWRPSFTILIRSLTFFNVRLVEFERATKNKNWIYGESLLASPGILLLNVPCAYPEPYSHHSPDVDYLSFVRITYALFIDYEVMRSDPILPQAYQARIARGIDGAFVVHPQTLSSTPLCGHGALISGNQKAE